MIKNVFIPEKIGNYYIFPKRIVGIDLGKTHVNATQLYFKGTAINLEKFINTPIEILAGNNYQERLVVALRRTLEQLEVYDELHSALPSSVVIFKELKLPFLGRDKIAMVVDFEIEPLIPFPVHEAVIDFIITRENLEEKSSEILVCAVQKIHVAQHLQIFEQAGAYPQVVTVDFLALYGLYQQIPTYKEFKGTVALIDLGSQTTRIGFIQYGQLRLIRSINKGVLTVAKSISEASHISLAEAMEELMRYGLERYDTPAYTNAITSSLTQLWNEISFTLNSLSLLGGTHQAIDRIIILGGGSEIKGLSQFVNNQLGIACEQFQVNELLHTTQPAIVAKNSVPSSNIMSLAIAYPSHITQDFTLRKHEFDTAQQESIFNRQLTIAGILILILLASLLAFSFFQTRKLSKEAYASEQEVINELADRFPRTVEGVTDLEEAVENAKQEARKEEQFWFSFANPNRVSFLAYLLELTSRIDQKSLGFVLDKLVITENLITMTGHVRDHEALYLLEKSLSESKLFAQVEKQQNPNFTNMKIKIARPV